MMLTGLARVAREAGITVREVPGWKTRTAHRGGMTEVRGVIWHHTATSADMVKSRNNPTLNYMVSGLGYPLANYGLAWDGSLDVIAAGTGAHAGKGVYKGIPRDNGNRYLIGVEVEGTIGLRWSDAQLETAARLGAQLNKDFGADLLHIAHYEWAPGRKTDPTGIPGNMPALRAAIKRGTWGTTITPAATTTATATTPPEEDEMTPAQMKEIKEYIRFQAKEGAQWATMGYDGSHAMAVHHETRIGVQALKGQVRALTEVVTELSSKAAPVTPEGVSAMLQRIEDRAVDTIASDYEIARKEK